MKILAVASAIDLSLKQAVPSWWQLFKGLYEINVDLLVSPYVGKSVETLWWKSYRNPCEKESLLMNRIVNYRKRTSAQDLSQATELTKKGHLQEKTIRFLTNSFTTPKWKRHLTQILQKQKDVDLLLFLNVPPNQVGNIPKLIKSEFGIPVFFYDMDCPDSLPGYSSARLASNWYEGADLTQYNGFITNSEGVIPILEGMGAHNVHALPFGVDPNIFLPIPAEQDIDVFFYGQGAQFRQDWINDMLISPSSTMPDSVFLLGGGPFKKEVGKVKRIVDMPISEWRKYCGRSKINLNITRKHHAEVYCSSTARIFELAALGCCIVSNPVYGLDKWFDVNSEVIMLKDGREAVETYKWLLQDAEVRVKMGEKVRQRVLREHTHVHMAKHLVDIIKKLN